MLQGHYSYHSKGGSETERISAVVYTSSRGRLHAAGLCKVRCLHGVPHTGLVLMSQSRIQMPLQQPRGSMMGLLIPAGAAASAALRERGREPLAQAGAAPPATSDRHHQFCKLAPAPADPVSKSAAMAVMDCIAR